jgi:hypothetical protein
MIQTHGNKMNISARADTSQGLSSHANLQQDYKNFQKNFNSRGSIGGGNYPTFAQMPQQ